MNVPGIDQGFSYYPGLAFILGEDVALTYDEAANKDSVESAFMLLDDASGLPEAALRVGNYYNAVGHTNAVYRVYRAYSEGQHAPPSYGQILVDEYQDFSLLEVRLIEALSQTSPVLIAGDDDQALDGFRDASPGHLRALYNDEAYAEFELPYCSRCTSAMVEALHATVADAQANGNLVGRIDKQYVCYLPSKRRRPTWATPGPHEHEKGRQKMRANLLTAATFSQVSGHITARRELTGSRPASSTTFEPFGPLTSGWHLTCLPTLRRHIDEY